MATPYSSFLPFVSNIGQTIGGWGQANQQAQIEAQKRQQEQQMQALKMMEEQMKIKQMQAPGDPKLIPGLGWVQVDPMTGQLKPVQGATQSQSFSPATTKDIGSGFTEIDYTDQSGKQERKFEKQGNQDPNSFEKDLEVEAKRLTGLGQLKGPGDVFKWKQVQRIKEKEAGTESGVNAKMGNIDIPALEKAIAEGRESIEGVKNAFGVPVQAVVQSRLAKDYPGFDFIKSDANKRYIMSPANLRSAGLAMAVYPRVEALLGKADAIGNIAPRTANMALNAISKEFGTDAGTRVVDFESSRNAIIQEVNTALSGSSASSDMRIVIEMENLKTANTPAQLRVAIKNLMGALEARQDASTAVLYPPEEVRGEKTFKNAKQRFDWYKKQIGLEKQEQDQPPMEGAKQAPDGKWYVPDPARPGKYLMVQ